MAEKTVGWDRKTVTLGLNGLRTGIVCVDNIKARGNKKTEVQIPQLEADVVSLAGPKAKLTLSFSRRLNLRASRTKASAKHLLRTKAGKLKICRTQKPLAGCDVGVAHDTLWCLF